MKIAVRILVLLLLAAAAAMAWQHARYLHARRDLVQDQQPLWHGSVFHVITFLRVPNGEDVIDAVRALKTTTEGSEGALWVYAGKVALNGLTSAQLEEVDWSAVVVLQYPSRQAYDAAAASEAHREALARFAQHYSHGLERGSALNLAVPQLLMGLRLYQIVTREPSHFPFVPTPAEELDPRVGGRTEELLAERELGAHAIAVVNLLKHGSAEQQAADRAYGLRMMGLMAEGGHGPMHMGAAVAVEGDASFDRVAIVYYPGVEYMASMIRSRFYQGIFGDKQPADTQSSVTVPILGLL